MGYRSIFPISLVKSIPNIPLKTLFWLGPDTSLYTTPIGDGLFEVSGRGPEPKKVGEAVSWGQPADKETMRRHFTVRDVQPLESSTHLTYLFTLYVGVSLRCACHRGCHPTRDDQAVRVLRRASARDCRQTRLHSSAGRCISPYEHPLYFTLPCR